MRRQIYDLKHVPARMGGNDSNRSGWGSGRGAGKGCCDSYGYSFCSIESWEGDAAGTGAGCVFGNCNPRGFGGTP